MKKLYLLISVLVLVSTLMAACGGAAPAPAAQPTTAPAAAQPAATTAPEKPATAVPPTPGPMATSQPVTLETFGLKPGKPYDGTKLKFLICCNSAPQFFSLSEKTKQFTDLTGITVEWGATPYGAFQEEIMKEGAAGNTSYDLVAWVDNWGPGLWQFIQPLDENIKADNVDLKDFPQAYLQPGQNKDGQQVGLPLRGHAYTLFYRKDVFDQLGLKTPETWADVEAAAKVIEEKTDLVGITPYYGLTGGQNLFTWMAMLWSNGGDIFDANWKPTFNNEAGIEATQRYVDWVNKLKIAPEASKAFGESEGQTEFAQGRAAMWLGWSWYYANFSNPKLSTPEVVKGTAFVPSPAWEGKGKPATYGYIWETGIFKDSKNKDAAWEYMKWMLSPQTEKWVAMDKSDPTRDNVVAVHYSVLNDPEVNAKHNNLQKGIAAILENARALPMMPDWLQVQGILEVAVNEMANGKPVKETLDLAAQDVQSLLERQGYYK